MRMRAASGPPMTTLVRMRAVRLWIRARGSRSDRHSSRIPVAPTRPPALHGKVFRGSRQVRIGRLTKGRLRSSAWRRLFPDVYACTSLAVDHRHRARAAAVLAVPGAVVSGRGAPRYA
jgi:hypothetical protein